MGEHQYRARRERQIGEEIATELAKASGLAMLPPEASTENQTVVEEIFTRVFDQYQINEAEGDRILEHTWKALARLKFAERNRQLDAATRQEKTYVDEGSHPLVEGTAAGNPQRSPDDAAS
ncbi:hypothetical protein SAMN05443247_06641 [Bradyrhizobium erythrophlei]|nr:hypothetical protein SAMN05443247_06641 [Bradyrhizobium erythrophlei]